MGDLPDWTRSVAVEVQTTLEADFADVIAKLEDIETEIIARTPTEYWLANNGTRIMEDGYLSNDTETLYTVPVGSTLYIVHAGLEVYAITNYAYGKLYTLNAAHEIILNDHEDDAGMHSALVSKVFVRVLAEEPVRLYGNSHARVGGYFVGYLMEEE